MLAIFSLDEDLRQERDFLQEFLHGAVGDLLKHGFRLVVGAGLLDGDATFGINQVLRHTRGVQRLRLGRGNVHRDVLAQLLVATHEVQQHADLGTTVDVREQLTLGFDAGEAADRHVLADLADQCGARRFDRTLAHRQHRQRGDVGRVLASNQFSAAVHQRQEVVVLGNEIGFAVHFDDRTELAVGRDADADHAFGGNAGGRLGGLVAQLDAQDLFSLGHVASRFGQRLLAFHHRRVGLLAQFLDHACGDFRHANSSDFAIARAG